MIRFIEDKDEKRKISREILEALTEWFEVEESREQYIRESADQPFWAYLPQKRRGQKAFRCRKRLCCNERLFIHTG